MPAIRTSSVTPSPYLVLYYQGRKVAVPRPESYEGAVAATRDTFSRLKGEDLCFEGNIDGFGSERVEISKAVWPLVASALSRVWISSVCQGSEGEKESISSMIIQADLTKKELQVTQEGTIEPNLTVKLRDESLLPFRVDMTTGIERIVYAGRALEDGKSLSDFAVPKGATLHMTQRLVCGKQVIYLYPPVTAVRVTISLRLVPAWEFATVFPETPVSKLDMGGSSIEWEVIAQYDGTLTDKRSRHELPYLSWESRTLANSAHHPSSPCGVHPFDPATTDLSPDDAVLVPISKVSEYLYKTLLVLGLHTEARTSFITYWFPALQAHKQIAVRFLPQTSYELAAHLDITPAADVVTRIFMLFKGIADKDLAGWEGACLGEDGEDMGVDRWKTVVGIQEEKMHDRILFRVLEYGGMEIK